MGYVRYMDKTREYYLKAGYAKPYQWAHFEDIPFAPLRKPLKECRVGLVSTSGITIRANGGKGEREVGWQDRDSALTAMVYPIPSDTPLERLYTGMRHFDTYETTLEDVNAFFPISHLRELVKKGRLGGLARRFQNVATLYSQRRTTEVAAPEVLRQCREDGVDVALLTPV